MLSVDAPEEILLDHQRSTIHQRINDFEDGKAAMMDLDNYMQQRSHSKHSDAVGEEEFQKLLAQYQ